MLVAREGAERERETVCLRVASSAACLHHHIRALGTQSSLNICVLTRKWFCLFQTRCQRSGDCPVECIGQRSGEHLCNVEGSREGQLWYSCSKSLSYAMRGYGDVIPSELCSGGKRAIISSYPPTIRHGLALERESDLR